MNGCQVLVVGAQMVVAKLYSVKSKCGGMPRKIISPLWEFYFPNFDVQPLSHFHEIISSSSPTNCVLFLRLYCWNKTCRQLERLETTQFVILYISAPFPISSPNLECKPCRGIPQNPICKIYTASPIHRIMVEFER